MGYAAKHWFQPPPRMSPLDALASRRHSCGYSPEIGMRSSSSSFSFSTIGMRHCTVVMPAALNPVLVRPRDFPDGLGQFAHCTFGVGSYALGHGSEGIEADGGTPRSE